MACTRRSVDGSEVQRCDGSLPWRYWLRESSVHGVYAYCTMRSVTRVAEVVPISDHATGFRRVLCSHVLINVSLTTQMIDQRLIIILDVVGADLVDRLPTTEVSTESAVGISALIQMYTPDIELQIRSRRHLLGDFANVFAPHDLANGGVNTPSERTPLLPRRRGDIPLLLDGLSLDATGKRCEVAGKFLVAQDLEEICHHERVTDTLAGDVDVGTGSEIRMTSIRWIELVKAAQKITERFDTRVPFAFGISP